MGLELHETPVGFNHIADYMMKEDVLIGGEESGGISFKGHIPEGDGPIMGLLLVEMIAASGASLYEMVEDLQKEVGPVQYERTDLRLKSPGGQRENDRKNSSMALLRVSAAKTWLRSVPATGSSTYWQMIPGC